MFYRLDPLTLMACIFLIFVVMSPLIAMAITTDKIEIVFNNDYLEEYNECKIDLERTVPICPACKCDGGLGNSIFAFMSGLIIMFLFYDLVLYPKFVNAYLDKINNKKDDK